MRTERGRARWGGSKWTIAPAKTADLCRVCHAGIRIGDPVITRAWHVRQAHAECGWFRREDVSTGSATALERGEPFNANEWACFALDGIAADDPKTGKRILSEHGEKLLRLIQGENKHDQVSA